MVEIKPWGLVCNRMNVLRLRRGKVVYTLSISKVTKISSKQICKQASKHDYTNVDVNIKQEDCKQNVHLKVVLHP